VSAYRGEAAWLTVTDALVTALLVQALGAGRAGKYAYLMGCSPVHAVAVAGSSSSHSRSALQSSRCALTVTFTPRGVPSSACGAAGAEVDRPRLLVRPGGGCAVQQRPGSRFTLQTSRAGARRLGACAPKTCATSCCTTSSTSSSAPSVTGRSALRSRTATPRRASSGAPAGPAHPLPARPQRPRLPASACI